MKQVKIAGTGSYVPEQVVTNEELACIVDTSDEWITTRTGIKKRHIAKKESTVDMAYEAGKAALEDANVLARDIDLILVATMTPDAFMPCTACQVQARLNATNAAAFDLSAACSGFLYAFITGMQYIQTGMYQNVLIIGADMVSKILDWKDRSTCVLFGDGAGACLLTESEIPGVRAVNMSSDGTKGSILTCGALPAVNLYRSGTDKMDPVIDMDGGEVFKFAVKSMVLQIKEVLKKAKVEKEEVSYIVPHQANIRIIDSAAKMLHLPKERFYVNLSKYGNTSAASVGIALDELRKTEQLKTGEKVILVGFGGGMTAGAVILDWCQIV